MTSDECISAVVIGAGHRGRYIYGQYAIDHPQDLKIVAVAEPHPFRRYYFARSHSIPSSRQFTTWEDLLQKKIADVAFICTQDQMHTQPALRALSLGYHVLVEKPMATEPSECILLARKAEETGMQLQAAHVLRYSTFFKTIHNIIHSGQLGRTITIDYRENVSYWHMAHSYVRGNWAKVSRSSPMILTKCCHDLDILYWLVGCAPRLISSFGSLSHFKPENAPPGATKRCLDGCRVADSCKYYAPRIYINIVPLNPSSAREAKEFKGWPVSTITEDFSLKGKREALKAGPYGRCVYFADNDVVDHQVAIIQFENETTATFTMHGHSYEGGRTIRIDGTKGTLIGELLSSGMKLILYNHLKKKKEVILSQKSRYSTASSRGPDYLMSLDLIKSFIRTLKGKDKMQEPLINARVSLESHLMAFAAEEARMTNKVISMKQFRKRFSR